MVSYLTATWYFTIMALSSTYCCYNLYDSVNPSELDAICWQGHLAFMSRISTLR